MRLSPRLLFLLAGALICVDTARASNLGTDNASNYGSWTNTSNGGTGFNPWSLNSNNSNGGSAGFFLGDSTTLGGSGSNSGGANINTNNNTAFGLYANNNSNVYANADRSFGNGVLSAGQVFSLDLAVNYRNGAKGINLRDNAGTVIFTFNVTNDNYQVTDAATTSGSFGAYSTNSAFHLSFSQDSTSGGSWTVSRTGGVTSTVSGTYNGDANSFRLFIGNTDVGDQNNLFANNLAITGVPEPATWLGGALVLASAGWSLRRPGRRRGTATA